MEPGPAFREAIEAAFKVMEDDMPEVTKSADTKYDEATLRKCIEMAGEEKEYCRSNGRPNEAAMMSFFIKRVEALLPGAPAEEGTVNEQRAAAGKEPLPAS